ncbi:hypothetical protein DFP72DRAFT_1176380 [Ephemerocybe angulata]|uniref:Uncharacterized protein n=1 Tax=Ephemerocybe angulata TaxID=980116 RepID=A0A8H6LVD3_9AGAR|nr:hypothetical protein DFP72DRAFT_1176380 [Tulosesus angulatus]
MVLVVDVDDVCHRHNRARSASSRRAHTRASTSRRAPASHRHRHFTRLSSGIPGLHSQSSTPCSGPFRWHGSHRKAELLYVVEGNGWRTSFRLAKVASSWLGVETWASLAAHLRAHPVFTVLGTLWRVDVVAPSVTTLDCWFGAAVQGEGRNGLVY